MPKDFGDLCVADWNVEIVVCFGRWMVGVA